MEDRRFSADFELDGRVVALERADWSLTVTLDEVVELLVRSAGTFPIGPCGDREQKARDTFCETWWSLYNNLSSARRSVVRNRIIARGDDLPGTPWETNE